MPVSQTATETPSAPRPRKCLRCTRTFLSEGNYQRICRACKRTRSPDDADPDDRFDSDASRARRERCLRSLMGLSARQRGTVRFFAGHGHRFDACQWIDGTPSADDSCKCGRRVRQGSAYCSQHDDRTRREPRTVSPGTKHRPTT